MASPGGDLNLKVCSARNLNNDRSLNLLVQVVCGDTKEKTTNRKCAVGQKNTFWNSKFAFYVPMGERVKLELRTKESFLSPSQCLGVSTLDLPDFGELLDVWVPIYDPQTNALLSGEIHCVLQFEPEFKIGSISSPNQSITSSPMASFSSTSRGVTSSFSQHPLSQPPSSSPMYRNTQQSEAPFATGQKAQWSEGNGAAPGKQAPPQRSSSEFDGHAAALTINELMDSLENVKRIIEAHNHSGNSPVVVQSPDPERLNLLRNARSELEEIQSQIESESSLSDEWRTKLVDLAEAYSHDLAILLSHEAWDDVNRRISHRLSAEPTGGGPPPLPAKPSPAAAKQHEEITKEFTLDSLELFDALLENGFAVQLKQQGDQSRAPLGKGDTVTLQYTAYIWDSVHFLAVSYASSKESGPWTFTIGDEDVPVGLNLAMEGLHPQAEFSICISPAFAFGESGSDLVPPNTHVVYEGCIMGTKSSSPSMKRYNTSEVDAGDLLKRNSRVSIRFPARQNRVSLAPPSQSEQPAEPLSPDGKPTFDQLTRAFVQSTNLSSAGSPTPPKPPTTNNKPPISAKPSLNKPSPAAPPPLPPRSDFSRRQSSASASSSGDSSRPLPPRPGSIQSKDPVRQAPPPPPPVAPSDSPISPQSPDNTLTESSRGEVAPQGIDAWLAEIGLQKFSQGFHDLGVEALADLELVNRTDLEAMGLRPIQIRKFAAQVSKLGIHTDLDSS